MDDAQWEARQAALADRVEPDDPDLEEDPDCSPPPGLTGDQARWPSAAREKTVCGRSSSRPSTNVSTFSL